MGAPALAPAQVVAEVRRMDMEPTRMVIRLSLILAGVLVLGAALPSWAGDCVGRAGSS
jgi:hypothetical protein